MCSYRSKSFLLLSQRENFHEARSKIDFITCHLKPPEPYSCKFCGFETNLRVDLSEHFRVLHKGKEEKKEVEDILKCYRCKNCDFESHSVVVLTLHTVSCNSLEQNERLLKRAQRKVGAKVNVLIEHSYSRSLKDYIEKPKNPHEGKIKANVVLEHSYSMSLNQYITKTTQPRRRYKYRWVQCGRCDFKSFYFNLKQHFETVHENSASSLIEERCCYRQCMGKSTLKPYIAGEYTVPKDIEWLHCARCDFKCVCENFFKQHSMIVHRAAKIAKRYYCDHCEYECMKKSTLKQHIESKHAASKDSKWFKCGQCSFKSLKEGYFKAHLIMKHKKSAIVKWFQCIQCQYKSKDRLNLSRHISREHVFVKISL